MNFWNELRIGNYIYEDETIYAYGINVNTIEVDLSVFKEIYTVSSDFYDMLKPIPLTEKWLFKFGFEIGSRGFLKLQLEKFTNSELVYVDGILRLVSGDGKFLTHDNLKHVHQLQNLYFALTGEELTIKETT